MCIFEKRIHAYLDATQRIEYAVEQARRGKRNEPFQCDTAHGGCYWCVKDFADLLREVAKDLDQVLAESE